ncbi:MAG: DNA adenine methylase [Candidatus Cloacimonetes bacterium]|nr:DNA adenine methylase [Candidatus Cloacimonadota bacterium]
MDALIGWIGGKRLLRKTIAQYVPSDITGYIEPFGGAAWMLFCKSSNKEDSQLIKKSRYTEVYNNINGDLVNF